MKKSATPSLRLCPLHLAASKHKHRLFSGLFVVASLLSGPAAWAANDAWSTNPTSGNFSETNWTVNSTTPGAATGTVATTGDVLYFGTSSITALNVDLANYSFAGFNFVTGANAFTFSGNAFALTGNITNSSTALQTINNALTTASVLTVTTTTGGGNVALAGNISGTGGGLTVAGTGALTLTGSNSYTANTSVGTNATLNINGATAISTGALVTTGNGTINNNSGAAITLTNNNAINLSGGSLTFTGTNDLSFGTGVVSVIGANRTITTTAATLTVGSIDADTTVRTLTKAGAGTLAITGAAGANFQGGYNTGAGTTLIGNKSSLGTGTLTFGGGTLSASADLSGSNAVANTIVQNGNTTVGGTNNLTFTGSLTNSGGSRTLTVNNTGATNFTGPVYLSEAAATARTLTVNGSGATTISGPISNANGGGTNGSLIYSGTGSLTLSSGGSTFAGASSTTATNTAVVSTTLNSGTLVIGADSTASNGTVTAGPLGTGALLIGAASIQGTGGARTIANPLRTTASAVIGGASDLTFTGGISNFANSSSSITVNNTGLTTFSGGAINGRADGTAAARTLTFSGSGRVNVDSAITAGSNDVAGTTTSTNFAYTGTSTLRSTGTNTYNGTTTVGSNTNSAGTLLINGSHTGGTNANALSTAYTVFGTLGGTGTINTNTTGTRTVTIANGTTTGGILAPGDSTLAPAAQTGILTITAPVTFANTATVATTFAVQLGGNTAGNGIGHYDQLNVTGTVTLGTNTVLSLSVVNNYAPARTDVLYLFVRDGTTAFNNAFVGATEGSTVTIAPGQTAMVTYLANWTGSEATSTLTGGNDLALYNFSITPVPEPSTWAAVGAMVGLYAYGRRRSRRNA